VHARFPIRLYTKRAGSVRRTIPVTPLYSTTLALVRALRLWAVIGFNESIQAGYLTKDPELEKVVTGDGEDLSVPLHDTVNRPGKVVSETMADYCTTLRTG
jgi:hypothetical protein